MPMLPEQIWRRRLESEYAELLQSSEKFEANPNKTNYVVSIKGKALYKDGDVMRFRDSHSIGIDLKREFPYPGGIEVTWLTPIFHPNIRFEDGRVCIQLIKEWSEAMTVTSVIKALKQLLKQPNPRDPLNKEAADYFLEHPDALTSLAPPEQKKPRIIIR